MSPHLPSSPLPAQEPTQDDFDRETSYVLAEDLNQTLNQVSSIHCWNLMCCCRYCCFLN